METLKDLAKALSGVQASYVRPMTEAELERDHDRRLADRNDPFYGFPCHCEICERRDDIARRSYSAWCNNFPRFGVHNGRVYRVAFGEGTYEAWCAGLTTREYLDTLPVYCPVFVTNGRVYAGSDVGREMIGHCPA